ncbi:uncharacterized protein LOC135294941 isoform X3 [Passer domesticus]|uniref:uncharacterized protein LOC135294941 isoform X3 n=1 Tax=Passer domesticus TaxID=48849 RepID=UPI0030FE7BB3
MIMTQLPHASLYSQFCCSSFSCCRPSTVHYKCVLIWAEKFEMHRCHSISQQDCVCCSTSCRAREANLRSTHIVIPSVVSFTMCSALATEFCLSNQLNGFPKSSEFSMPDSAPVARTFMAAVSFALGSDGEKKKSHDGSCP